MAWHERLCDVSSELYRLGETVCPGEIILASANQDIVFSMLRWLLVYRESYNVVHFCDVSCTRRKTDGSKPRPWESRPC